MTRSNQLQRMHAVGNTELTPRYHDVYEGGKIAASFYRGHRPSFKTRWRSPLMGNVSCLKVGPNVAQAVLELLIAAAAAAGRPRHAGEANRGAKLTLGLTKYPIQRIKNGKGWRV